MRATPGIAALVVVSLVCFVHSSAFAQSSESGQFQSDGKSVDEFHCVPAVTPAPAVVILHGAGPSHVPAYTDLCTKFAAAGFYAEFIEYYSQTGMVGPIGSQAQLQEDFPTWMAEIIAGIGQLKHKPRVQPGHIGIVGYSLGAYLALAVGAESGHELGAIVDYYGGLPKEQDSKAANLPPILILHGDADTLVPVEHAHDLAALLQTHNRPYEIQIYPGARHAFNFPLPGWYNQQDGEDAWRRTIAFLDKYLKGVETAPAKQPSAAGSG